MDNTGISDMAIFKTLGIDYISGSLLIANNNITSLNGCPNVSGHIYAYGNKFEDVPEDFKHPLTKFDCDAIVKQGYNYKRFKAGHGGFLNMQPITTHDAGSGVVLIKSDKAYVMKRRECSDGKDRFTVTECDDNSPYRHGIPTENLSFLTTEFNLIYSDDYIMMYEYITMTWRNNVFGLFSDRVFIYTQHGRVRPEDRKRIMLHYAMDSF